MQDALGVEPNQCLPGYSVRILDGNCLAAGEKRLRVRRGVSGAAPPGKSLVVMDPQRRLLTNVFPCEDGHAQERSLLDQVIPTIQAGELWIADRNFCTRGFLQGVQSRSAYVLFRQHGGLPFRELTPWTAPITTEAGQQISEQQIDIEGRRYRRIRVDLIEPIRDGDRHIDLIADAPETVDAATLAALYRKRWKLETAFQHLEAHLESEIDTLAYPRAALFGFCLALVAYKRLLHGLVRTGQRTLGNGFRRGFHLLRGTRNRRHFPCSISAFRRGRLALSLPLLLGRICSVAP